MTRRLLIPVVTAMLAMIAVSGCAGTYDTSHSSGYARSPGNADESGFYEALSPYGDWIRSAEYGLVWCPYEKQVDWRPYSDGEWVWTDYGWAWVADEDWGWATYHYGRWYDDPYDGWCWVPGQEWAPAWVAWRTGDGWVGWAPLPPELTWQAGTGIRWNDWDNLPGVQHHWWSFCRERDLPGRNVRNRLAPRHQSVVLVVHTRNITNYTIVDNHVANRSLDVDPIGRAYGKRIAVHQVNDLGAPPTGHGRQLAGNSYNAYRPRLNEASAGAAPNRIRAARPDRTGSVPSAEVSRQALAEHKTESQALGRREAADRQRLQRDQTQETRKPPTGVDAQTLRQQHQEQQEALDSQASRDQRVLRARQEQKQQDGRSTGVKKTRR